MSELGRCTHKLNKVRNNVRIVCERKTDFIHRKHHKKSDDRRRTANDGNKKSYLILIITFKSNKNILCKTSHYHSMAMFKSQPFCFRYYIWQASKIIISLSFWLMVWIVWWSMVVFCLWRQYYLAYPLPSTFIQ